MSQRPMGLDMKLSVSGILANVKISRKSQDGTRNYLTRLHMKITHLAMRNSQYFN